MKVEEMVTKKILLMYAHFCIACASQILPIQITDNKVLWHYSKFIVMTDTATRLIALLLPSIVFQLPRGIHLKLVSSEEINI